MRDLKWPPPTSDIARIFSRSALVRMGWRTSRRLRWEAPSTSNRLGRRPDDGHEAHDQLFADRIDRRVGYLGEVPLEIGEEELRPVRQRRDGRVVAHGADRFLARHRHGRHQDAQVLLGVPEGLLAIEQREVRERRLFRLGGRSSSTIWVALEPLLIGSGSSRASP